MIDSLYDLKDTPAEFKMIGVGGGHLVMDETKKEYRISDFYIGETLVTQALWEHVMQDNPSRFSGKDRPVESVSWFDAAVFCNALSEMTSRNQYYFHDKLLQQPFEKNNVGNYTEEGDTVRIQGEEQRTYSNTRGDTRESKPINSKMQVRFEEALGTIKSAAGALKRVIDQINPDEVSVEFSLKTEGEAGFFAICKASTAAEFKITLTWKGDGEPHPT